LEVEMKIKLGISYSSRWAYVDSVIYQGVTVEQTLHSWRSLAIIKFCFHGKVINVKLGELLSVDGDELDEEFLRVAKRIPASEYGFWRQTYDALENGKKRSEVLESLQAYAIARGLMK
jgi:hypothetical protein